MSRFVIILFSLFLVIISSGLGTYSHSSQTDHTRQLLVDSEANNIDKIKTEIDNDNFEQAIKLCKNSLADSKEYSNWYVLNLNILLIKSLNYNEQYEEALRESEKLYIEKSKVLEKEIILLKEYYFQRAYSYNGLHNQKYEIEYTLKALTIMQSHPSLFKTQEFISLFNDLYYYQNNYEDRDGMNDTYLQYLKFYNSRYEFFDDELMSYARRILRKMQVIETLENQNPIKAEEILNEFKSEVRKPYQEDDLAYLNSCYASIADYFYFIKNYSQTIQVSKRYLAFAEQSRSKFNVMLAYSKLATASQQSGDFENGLEYTNLSLESFDFGPFSASLHALNIIKGKCLVGLNKHKEAILLAEQTIESILSHKMKKSTTIQDYNIDEIKELNSHNYINIFASAALLFLDKYKIDKQKEDIVKAEKLLRTSTAMFKEFYLQGSYNPTLYNLHNKNSEGLLYIATEKYSNQPNKQKEILNLLEENTSKHLFRSYQHKAGKAINDIMNQFDASKLNNVLTQVQSEITEDENVLKYYVLEHNTYLVRISKTSTKLIHIAKTSDLRKNVFFYLETVRNLKPNYEELAKKLAEHLIPKELSKKIIIISDNFLNYIPFESLINSNQDDFSVANHQFSYAYSLSILLWNQHTLKFHSNKKAIVFNPSYEKGAHFGKYETPNLPYSQQEAKHISKAIDAKLIANDARKEDFTVNCNHYDLFHFSMHAVVDDDNYKKSCLLFSKNEPLYFEELYDMKIPADMVVLGACNTGNGKLKNGEGIMSLSLAFSFAGTRSTVYSLWEAPDAATAEILGLYYQELKKGFTKDLALANAKRQFLKKNPMMSHPFFWSGFIVNGDISPIFEAKDYFLLYIVGILATALIIAVLLYRLKKLV